MPATTIWVINPKGSLTTIDGEGPLGVHQEGPLKGQNIYTGHPAYGPAKERKEAWREATIAEIAKWARSQAAGVVIELRKAAVAQRRPEPTDAEVSVAVGNFYRSQGFAKPSAAEVKAAVAEAEQVEGALDLSGALDLDEAEDAPTVAAATDSAIEHAAELGVDLATVEGSGKGGVITKADVAAAAKVAAS